MRGLGGGLGMGRMFRFGVIVGFPVLSIHLSWNRLEDMLIWHGEKDEEFTVKSTYHLMDAKRDVTVVGPSRPPNKDLWKKIWQTHVHIRVKIFLWRLARNILPTYQNLRKKGMNLNLSCPLCDASLEFPHHLFLSCSVVKLVWLESILSSPDPVSIQLICVALWSIWYYRNQWLFQKIPFVPRVVVESVADFLVEFNSENLGLRFKKKHVVFYNGGNCPRNFVCLQVDAGCFPDNYSAFG
ncbi:unnamed protein product [Vicia faba]|uniref:Reverse transcriptase zinc-binding domain-containing protein n=1 Tax=Vicia faba TaxID=3906 RepID=A0AAV0YYL5_VICFA|nr:unnamed protein product [Vicia faba]